ncbi:MAG TPA: GGDEF domain-containing protein, partial [Candidatus Eisenbacteria bacterium]|nr:GGDEF domain-containing protein [Candidatus Eisenbacteria bacterium]
VAKYGGDEFVVILPQTTREGARVLADRVKSAVEGTAFPLADPGVITVSLGVATYPENGITAGELLESADIALYAAKQTGKNRVSLADGGTMEPHRSRGERAADDEAESSDSF